MADTKQKAGVVCALQDSAGQRSSARFLVGKQAICAQVGWYSPFLLAAYDPEAEEFQSVCRCMSGFTDAFYAEVLSRFLPVCSSSHVPLLAAWDPCSAPWLAGQ